MRRREFICLFYSATAWPLTLTARAARRIPRVGYISGSSPKAAGHVLEAFRKGLQDRGYVEGQSIDLEVRWAEGRSERLPGLVAELVRLNVDVLVMANSPAVIAAKKATTTIPIIMFAADPVGEGLVASLSRPGWNVTGLSYRNEEITGRRLQFLKELVPRLIRIGVLRNPTVALQTIFWKDTEDAARKLEVMVEPIDVRGPEDFEVAFAMAKQSNVQAVVALDDALMVTNRSRIVALAASHRLPAIYGYREFTDEGGLMSYGVDVLALFERGAVFVEKILKGAKPANLPVEQSTKLELVINLRTAKALGLTVPPTLLAQANEVIE